jgi:SAM-dependent methyltransferase
VTDPRPNFNLIARPYRWLEYLTLGPGLERCRQHFLPNLAGRTHALVLGDGDGRFLARLLQQNPTLQADAVDISATMLHLLRERCHRASPSAATRLKAHHAEALAFLATSTIGPYDLVVTHFFLDCLTQPELNQLASSIAPRLVPGSLWLVSDFSIPSGSMRWPAKLLVRALYLAFRILTGLRVSRLPDHATALSAAGLTLHARHISLCGMLVSEIWQFSY